jgi:AcrR family transcriptional regulator
VPSRTVPRKTQAERTAATRAALLEATVHALAEHGYAGASTTEIARRAGVSRGAQLHHFPSKLDLVAAALDHVFAVGEAEFRAGFSARPPADRNQGAAIDELWRIFRGPRQAAVTELLTAARTDPELRPLARRVLRDFESSITEIYAEVVPGAAADETIGARVLLAMAVLGSAAAHRQLGLGAEADALVATLGALADAFPLAPPADTTTAPTATVPPRGSR